MTTDNLNTLELITTKEILAVVFIILLILLLYIYYSLKIKRSAPNKNFIYFSKFASIIILISLPILSGYFLHQIRLTYYSSEQDSIFFSDVIYGPAIAFLISLLFLTIQTLDLLLTDQESLPAVKIKTESATIESSSTSMNADEIEVTAENIDVSSAQINVDAKNTTANATQANIVSSKADIKTQNATILNVAESSDTKEPK